MSIDELLSTVSALSHAEKFRLARFVLEQLAQEDGVSIQASAQASDGFDPRPYYGAAHESREAVEAYLSETREGWT